MSLQTDGVPVKIVHVEGAVNVGEVLLDLKEDMGGLKAGVEHLVKQDVQTQKRLVSIEKSVATDSVEQGALKERVASLEKTSAKQGDKLTKLVSYAAILIALMGNLLPAGVRDAIAGVFGQ